MISGQENWIDLYVSYTDKQESPKPFQFWSAVSVIASVLGRKVFIDRGYFVTYPNQYIILTAETARCRKSTASEIAIDDILMTAAQVTILTERLTTEVICVELSKPVNIAIDNSILIFCSELSTFLNVDAVRSGKIDMLTSLYTCPASRDYKTKNVGKYRLRNVCINLLGCTTLNWMADNMPGTAIEGGFTGRVLFVVAEDPRCFAPCINGALSESKNTLHQVLISDLSRIADFSGEFTLDIQAKKLFKSWYHKLRVGPVGDPRLAGYFSRKAEHVLKTAMALRAAEFSLLVSKDLVLTVDHLQRAIWELEGIEKLMPLAYRGATYSKSSKHNDRILRQLEKSGGVCEHSKLLRNNSYYLDADEFKKVMFTLTDSKQVVENRDGNKRLYMLNK